MVVPFFMSLSNIRQFQLLPHQHLIISVLIAAFLVDLQQYCSDFSCSLVYYFDFLKWGLYSVFQDCQELTMVPQASLGLSFLPRTPEYCYYRHHYPWLWFTLIFSLHLMDDWEPDNQLAPVSLFFCEVSFQIFNPFKTNQFVLMSFKKFHNILL